MNFMDINLDNVFGESYVSDDLMSMPLTLESAEPNLREDLPGSSEPNLVQNLPGNNLEGVHPRGQNSDPSSPLDRGIPVSNNPSIDKWDGASISVPGNPSLDNPGGFGIPTGTSTEISADVWNNAMTQIKKTFKEAIELMDEITSYTVVQETVEEQQRNYTESLMFDVVFESYTNGPFFEAVKDPRKHDIKVAVNAIIKAAHKNASDKYNLTTFRANAKEVAGYAIGGAIANALIGIISPSNVIGTVGRTAVMGIGGAAGAAGGAVVGARLRAPLLRALREDRKFVTQTWQMVGVFRVKDDEVSNAIAHYKKEFADQLGDLTLNYMKVKVPDLGTGTAYVLIVDSAEKQADTITIPKGELAEEKKETKAEQKQEEKEAKK